MASNSDPDGRGVIQRACARCGAGLRRGRSGGMCDPCARRPLDIAERLQEAGFFSREPIRRALAALDFGYLFRAVRRTAGLTQVELGEVLELDQDRISRIERGERPLKDFETIARIATRLGIPLILLGFSVDTTGVVAQSAAPARDLHAESAVDALSVNKREARGGSIALRPGTPSGDWNMVSCPSRSIATIRAMSESFQIADRKLGGGLLYRSVVRYIKLEIAPSLLDPPRDCSSGELFSAAASLTEAAGWMAHDGGCDDQSQRHFKQAYHLAVTAGNPTLCANVCASLSHLAIQRGQTEDAARISAAGLELATRDEGAGTEQLVARLYAMCARAAAMQGRTKDCYLALDAARNALCNCMTSTRAGWISGFDEASLASESALCFYSLEALDEAEDQARKVIELRHTGDRVRSLAFGQLTLANVLFKAGAIGEAARTGSEICLLAASVDSARIRSGIFRLGKLLDVNRADPDVAAFLDNLTQLTEKTVAVSPDEIGWPL
ncbi:MAG: helix-turn-helix domain-containing protein [Pseudonocardiaceae bacterium]